LSDRRVDGGSVPALCYNLLVEPRADERNPDYALRLRGVLHELEFLAEYIDSIDTQGALGACGRR